MCLKLHPALRPGRLSLLRARLQTRLQARLYTRQDSSQPNFRAVTSGKGREYDMSHLQKNKRSAGPGLRRG